MALDRTKTLCLFSILLYDNNKYHIEYLKNLATNEIISITENDFRTKSELMNFYNLTDYDYLLQIELI